MDALVIGCGLTGSVVARFLAENLIKKLLYGNAETILAEICMIIMMSIIF